MSKENFMKIIECSRDAMQGRESFISTEKKIDYINALLSVGFPMIDCGSFVSPKAIPQMADTKEVLNNIDKSINPNSKISVVIASKSGADRALEHQNVDTLGYAFSISENFQHYNTNKSREEAFDLAKEIMKVTENSGKELMVYFSMAFGNPYNEEYNEELVLDWVKRFADIGVKSINLSDTVGLADRQTITDLFTTLLPDYEEIEFGAHFHTVYDYWFDKVDAAYLAGCRKFDGAIKGLGGCPMAKSDMVGNMPTEKLITYANEKHAEHGLSLLNFEAAWNVSLRTFDN